MSSLRSQPAHCRDTYVDAEEAAMRRAMARLGGEDKARRVGQRYSEVNRTKIQNHLQEQAALGLVPMRPDEVDAARKQQASTYKSNSERGINVPRVGLGAECARWLPIPTSFP